LNRYLIRRSARRWFSYADQAPKWHPKDGENFDLEDVRKDEECTDTVGVFLKVDGDERVLFRVILGPQIQTLTKAMTSILCRGLRDATVQEVLDVPADFVPKIVGGAFALSGYEVVRAERVSSRVVVERVANRLLRLRNVLIEGALV